MSTGVLILLAMLFFLILGLSVGYFLGKFKEETKKEDKRASFTIFWNNGKSELLKGDNIVKAMLTKLPNINSLADIEEDYFYKEGNVKENFVYVNNEWVEVKNT